MSKSKQAVFDAMAVALIAVEDFCTDERDD